MSSTTNVQSLLANVFRPVYAYAANVGFQTSIELSNIDTVSANNAILLRADVADSNGNVFVGTTSGLNANNCSYTSAFGYGAGQGISNVSNGTFLGFQAGANSSSNANMIAIGNNAGVGVGASSNILIGYQTGTGGSIGANNILLGNGVKGSTAMSNQFQLGYSNSTSNIAIAADLAYGVVAIGKTDTTMTANNSAYWPPGNPYGNRLCLDVAGYARVSSGLSIGTDPGTRTLDVNGDFRAGDGSGSIVFTTGILTVSNAASSLTLSNATFAVSNTVGSMTVSNDTTTFASSNAAGPIVDLGTGGIFSLRGSNVSTTSVLFTAKKGMYRVMATNGLTGGPTSWEECVIIGYATTAASKGTFTNSGSAVISVVSGSNVQLAPGGGGTFSWVALYSPVP